MTAEESRRGRTADQADHDPRSARWSGPVRYAMLAGLVAVVGIGLVTVLYDRGILSIAGPFALVFLLPVLIPLQRRGLRRRGGRQQHRTAARRPDVRPVASPPVASATPADALQRLEQHLRDERALSPDARRTTADDESLDGVLSLVARARTSSTAGHREVAGDLLAQAAYVAADSWSPSPVASEVLVVHQSFVRASHRA